MLDWKLLLSNSTPYHIFVVPTVPLQLYYREKVDTFDQNLHKLSLCTTRNIYSTVCLCLPKNFPNDKVWDFCQEIYKNVEIDVESFPAGYTVNDLEFFLTTYTDWAFFSKSSHQYKYHDILPKHRWWSKSSLKWMNVQSKCNA